MAIKRISDDLKDKHILLSDGAWGTEIMALGLKSGQCPDLWSLTRYDAVKGISKRYIEAGADIIKTNSFGANRFKLFYFGLSDRTQEINTAAAKASREAAGNSCFVVASVGPTGKMLITQEVTEKEMYDAFKEQIVALENGGVDAVLIETMSDIEEACIAIRAAKENTDLEIICTFAFDKTISENYMTMMGVSPTASAAAAIDAGADIIGANCGNGFDTMIDITKELRTSFKNIPVLIHANAGIPQLIDSKTIFPETPENMSKGIKDLISAGANIIGGCCGTTPAHIRSFRAEIDKYLSITYCQNG